jgi:hypothetical protein
MMPKYKLPGWFVNAPHRPPHAGIGAKEDIDLYVLVGRICSDWEIFEHKLMILLTVVAGFASTEQAVAVPFRAAFRSVISARGKQDILLYVVEETMAGRPEYDPLIKLLRDIGKLTGLRNKAVHATVGRHDSPDPDRAWFVAPGASSKDYGLRNKPFRIAYRFNDEQLRNISFLIRRFDGIVGQFFTALAFIHHEELKRREASRQTPPEPAGETENG